MISLRPCNPNMGLHLDSDVSLRSHAWTVIVLLLFFLACREAYAENGVTADKVIFGSTGALSGPVRIYGEQVLAGGRAYFSRLNKQGGVHGRKIEIMPLDDGYQPERAFENARKLIEDSKVFGLFGAVGTPTAAAVVPYLKHTEGLSLFPYTGGDFLRVPVIKSIFVSRASFSEETYTLAKYASTELGLRDFGIFYQDDIYGYACKSAIEKALGESSLRLKESGAYVRNTNSVDVALAAMLKSRPKAVFLISVKAPAVEFIRRAAQAGYKPIFLAPSPVGALDLLEAMGKDADNIYQTEAFPLATDTTQELVRDYQRDMKAAGYMTLSNLSLESYFGAAITAEALKRAGADLNKKKLISTLETMSDVDVEGVRVGFSPQNHQGASRIFLMKINAGVISPVKRLK